MAKPKYLKTSDDLDLMMERAREASDMLKAMAHETRLVLLCILREGERSVSELETILGERQAAVSQQLARLRLERLVDTRRDGATVYYRLSSPAVQVVLEALYGAFCAPPKKKR